MACVVNMTKTMPKPVVESSIKALFYFYQKPDMTNDEYLKEFKAWVKSMDDYNAFVLGKFPSNENESEKNA